VQALNNVSHEVVTEKRKTKPQITALPILDNGNTTHSFTERGGKPLYNVAIIYYPDGHEVRVFEHSIKTGEKPEKPPSKLPKKDKQRSEEVSVKRSQQKIYQHARANKHDYFVTFTGNPEKVDTYNYDEFMKTVSKWLNNLRRTCPNLKYLVVPERHKSGRYHAHALMSNIDEMEFKDSGKRTKSGLTIYNLPQYKIGFTTATKVTDSAKASRYIAKYVTKELMQHNPGKQRYRVSQNMDKPTKKNLLLLGQEKKEYVEQLATLPGLLYQQEVKIQEPGYTNTITYFSIASNT
jgi:hypothetical protein